MKTWFADKQNISNGTTPTFGHNPLILCHHDFDGPDMICVLHPFLKDGFQLSEILHVVGKYIVLLSEQNGSEELSSLCPLIF